ncbi:MAG: YajQ family cyclic di-GMP-binding protein [Pseudomonadota bacterium]
MPSFDIVSKTDLAEVDNALSNLRREIEQRYDFKGSASTVERNGHALEIHADDDLKLKQIHELLKGHLTRRKIEAGVLSFGTVEKAAGQSVRQTVTIREGIDSALAKDLTKAIKGSKLKVQASIQGDEVRISGKKRDDLQAAIQHVKGMDIEQPLQFVNFRD